jgi:hypothetical protein
VNESLRFYSYDGVTNYLKCKIRGLQGEGIHGFLSCHPAPMGFKIFPELRGLTYSDDGNIIGRLSQVLKLTTVSRQREPQLVMFTLGTHAYIRNFVVQNCLKIGRNVEIDRCVY